MAGDADSQVRPATRNAPLALYRRYRPATFAELKGQDHVTEPLRQALRSGRVHHAYLFSGPRGCGKTSSARILARSLNCEIGPTPDPCGKCASCVALAPSGPGSIDVIEIDAASHGGIDDARDLRERAFYSPVAARFKIYIIDEAHMVTGAGFNALLKLVEEPPPHLKFVFATTEPEKVIPTIRSRTHHYPFRLVPPAVLRELLEEILNAEKIGYEPAVLPVVIRAGAGSVRDTLSVLDQLMAGADDDGLRYDRAVALLGYTDDALLDETTEAFAAADGALVFRAIDHVVEAGHDPRRFAMDLLDRMRDLIVLAAVPDAGSSGLLDVAEDRLDRMREQARSFGQERLVRAAETISNGLVEMRGATSPRLLLELMCAQVLLPASGQNTAGRDLDGRIERLERDLAAALDRLAASPPGQVAARESPAYAADSPREPARAGQGERPRPPARPEPARPEPQVVREPQVGQEPPGRPAGAAAARPAAGTDLPGEAELRGRWDEVLSAIRDVRKVAWILLSNATVESVEGNVVTLAFAREGDAKGFGTSGCDQDLADVLDRTFGIRPVIRTSVQSGPSRTATQEPADTRPARAGSDRAGSDRAGSDEAAPVPESSAADSASVNRFSARSSPKKARPAEEPGGRTAGAHRPADPGPAANDDPRPLTDPQAPASAPDVTGTDLIMRELGGQVIEEIGEN
jgi:DNA polymerase-3 subunit gamma/tau